ncbi:MAG: 6-bladed beta-propeller [Bacteroidetes bacterium]|jgi:hypothetical protein|nr:6-bladed beta-propeller [Bacteroidota bacterium]
MDLLKKISIPIFLFLCIVSCSQTPQEKSPVKQETQTISVDLNEAVETLPMSKFFSSLEYKLLETPPNKPIGRIRKIMPQENYIALFDKARKSVWIFDYDGSFINEISIPTGRGPGEVTDLSDVIISDDGLVHAMGAFKIVVYNSKGEFIRATEFDFFIYNFMYNTKTKEYIGYADNSLNQMLQEHGGHNLLFFDHDGNINRSAVPIPKGREHIGYLISNRFPRLNNQNHHYFFSHLSDTVYTIQNSEVSPRYILDYGEDSIPEEVFDRRNNYSDVVYEWVDFMREEIEAQDYISFLSFFNDTDRYIHFRIGTRNDQYNVLFNKQTGETIVGPNRFTNDIDYGYVPFMYGSSDKALYTIIESHNFINHINEIYENERQKYADPRMRPLIKLAHEISENSNPVLQIATFKSGD